MAFHLLPYRRARDDDRNIEVVETTARMYRDTGPGVWFFELKLPHMEFEFGVQAKTSEPYARGVLLSAEISGFRAGLNRAIFDKKPELFKNLPALEFEATGATTIKSYMRRLLAISSSNVILESEIVTYQNYAADGVFLLLTDGRDQVAPDFSVRFKN